MNADKNKEIKAGFLIICVYLRSSAVSKIIKINPI